MPLTGISNRGLLVIAFLVVILWGCIFAQHAIVRQARQETLMLLRSRRPAVPVKMEGAKQPHGAPKAYNLRSLPEVIQADLKV